VNTLPPPTPLQGSAANALAARPLEYLQTLWKRRWVILLVAGLGCLAAYGWTLKQPRIYQADCTLQYDPNPPRPLGNEVADVASPMVWWESREFFLTQNKIIGSRAIAEKVVRKLSLNQNADFWNVPSEKRAAWRGATVSETAEALQGLLVVNPERETRIVHLMVKDRDPKRAKLLANTIADSYIEKTMEDRLSTTTGALEWLGAHLDTLKSQLEHSELALHDFTEQHSNLAVSLEDQQNIVSGTIRQLSVQLTQTKTKRIELAARVDELKTANNDDPMEVHASSVLANSAVQALRDRYRALLTERDGLIVSFGDKHPKILAVDSQIATVKLQVRHEIDGLISAAEADLHEVEQVEKGVQGALQQANGVGLELNLQDITYRRLQRERDNTSKLYGTLLERTAQTDLTRALSVSFVRVVDQALLPVLPVSPKMHLNLSIGVLLGLMLGIGLASLLDQLDRTIRTVEDAEALGITILGIMPRIENGVPLHGASYARRRKNAPEIVTNRDLVVHTHPKSSVAECCRTIRTNLTFMSADRPQRAIVVTSASPREGKTTVVISLAISLAQGGKRVLLIDTDLRKPRVHKALNRSNAKGVTTVLVSEHTSKQAIQTTDIPGLDLLASGPIPPNPAELLHTPQFRDLVSELSRKYDHILFDSPPLAAVTDAAIISPQVDGVILVVHGQKTTRDALRSALRQLHDVNAHVTGGVLNDVDLSSRQHGYGSYYYYHNEGYYEANAEDRQPEAPAAES
jgi:succinoglycan biosynthesis transport protein ExoP